METSIIWADEDGSYPLCTHEFETFTFEAVMNLLTEALPSIVSLLLSARGSHPRIFFVTKNSTRGLLFVDPETEARRIFSELGGICA